MLRRSLRSFVFLMVLLSLNFQKILPNLLPGTVVQIGPDEYSYVENLQKGQLVVTQHEEFPEEFHRTKIFEILKRENHTDRAVLIELKPKNGEAGLLMVGEGQYFHRQNAAARLKPKLLKHVKQGKKKALKVLLNALWVKAEDLKEGDKLVGKNGQTLYVTRVEHFEFKEEQDFYEISLKYHHLYCLVDTAGNRILTHNIEPITICAWIIAGCAIAGGVGGGVYECKTSKRDGGPTARDIVKGVFWGALGGAVVGAIVSTCLYAPDKIKDAYSGVKLFIKNHKTAVGVSTGVVSAIVGTGLYAYSEEPNKNKTMSHSR
ncbi:MAG: hypothetical protein ABIF12_00190 [bacterium]